MMKSKKILLCGYFAFGTNDYGGQPVKGRELYNALCRHYGNDNVDFLDTKNWKKHPLRLIAEYIKKVKKAECVIMLPAKNGVEVFARLLYITKKVKRIKIFYSVIGGWLTKKTENEKILRKILSNFDGIWVETSSMKSLLESQKINNVTVIPNFKNLRILREEELTKNYGLPFQLCTFSRVMAEKGIEDAINAVNMLNSKYGKTVFSLDIYGQIDDGYADKFKQDIMHFPEYIQYKGIVDSSESVDTIKKYYALLFPTHFYTEGIPGTLIDALCAGVPVISAKWMNSSDILVDGETGIEYEFDSYEEFVSSLERSYLESSSFIEMKEKCLKKALYFTPNYALSIIDNELKKVGD